ncbi:MAG: CinA family nicotinamide mononucleotide deamidase-related protein [Deltaproteobacteria bacterium]|nr:CinA family nicotinamide mononucleotide deamidase-related protein [Deltaproteobacteria bacterium]
MPNAEIVAVGSELLLGQIVDTNSAWIAHRLTELGINLFYKTVVGDNPGRMREVISRALERSDLVITSGGIGPTRDDLTREIVAAVTGRDLVLDSQLLEEIRDRFRRRGQVMTPNNERQAYMPAGAIPVRNPNGTAPAFILEDLKGVIFVLPGVPFEMKWLFENEVEPYLRRKFDLSETIAYRVLKVVGMGESAVDQRVGDLIANSTNPTVGVLAHPGQVDVRITAKASSRDEAMRLIAPVEAEVCQALGSHVFARDNETMEDIVGHLLRNNNKSIAVFEDLTGGLLAGRLQQAAPENLVEGIIAGSPASIRRLLKFSRRPQDVEALLQDPAALTAELARAVREQAGSDLGVALHALPNPDEKVENLASGETSIAVTDGKEVKHRIYRIAGRGQADRVRMTLNALELIRMAFLEGLP